MLLVAAVMASACVTGVRPGGRCRGASFGDDGVYVLRCENGRWKRLATKAQTIELIVAIIKARREPVPATSPTAPPVVSLPADLTELARFIASVPDLAPTETTIGCQKLRLLELDFVSRSAKVLLSLPGESPCPGDPLESYFEITGGQVTRSLGCSEAFQPGECDQFSQFKRSLRGRSVSTIDVRLCGPRALDVCIDSPRVEVLS